MDEDSLYDEFGNYLGDPSSSHADLSGGRDAQESSRPSNSSMQNELDHELDMDTDASGKGGMEMMMESDGGREIVLLEDKKFYASAEETYGPDVETLVQEEDTQPLSEPMIAPIHVDNFEVAYDASLSTHPPPFTREFLDGIMKTPDRIRSMAVVGDLHHGKSSLVDLLLASSGSIPNSKAFNEESLAPLRFTDSLLLERQRGISLRMTPVTFLGSTSKGASHLLYICDAPGHADFGIEVGSALRVSDGVLLVVDIVEGLQSQGERALKAALSAGLPIVLVLNKMDRLITELRLPPTDAYFKIKHVIEAINTIIGEPRFSPEKGNVVFASVKHGWIFTLHSFAEAYAGRCNTSAAIDAFELSTRLWGDIYWDPLRSKFRRTPFERFTKRTFVGFILEPLYKIYTHVIGEEREVLEPILLEMGVRLKAKEFGMNVKPLLRRVLSEIFGDGSSALIDVVVKSVPGHSPKHKDADELLLGHVVKLYPTPDSTRFDALTRVLSGQLVLGQTVKILGEKYTPIDPEDSAEATITGLALPSARHHIPVVSVSAGNLVLISGIDSSITRHATIVATSDDQSLPLPPVEYPNSYVAFSVAVEPRNPADLPKLLSGLRSLGRCYPLLSTRVHESGEHSLMGPGELYLDCALHDLRMRFGKCDVKVADPVTPFAETVVETSYLKCFGQSPNAANKITMIAEPMEPGLSAAIEEGRFIGMERKILGKVLMNEFGWDILAARSLWAFGPDPERGPNVLIDDTLPSETDSEAVAISKPSIIQGFQWATRAGPLCDEPIRGVKFRLLDVILAPIASMRTPAQLIPTTRRVCFSAFLTASPRLMEPVYRVDILAPVDCVEAAYTVLARRRGHVISDTAIGGTPLYSIHALLPTLDSVGFEIDLRTHTQGLAHPLLYFSHWQPISGDPLDRSIALTPLEPAAAPQLARDVLLKTRRRKGLGEDVSIEKFFDDPMLAELASGFPLLDFLCDSTLPPNTLKQGLEYAMECIGPENDTWSKSTSQPDNTPARASKRHEIASDHLGNGCFRMETEILLLILCLMHAEQESPCNPTATSKEHAVPNSLAASFSTWQESPASPNIRASMSGMIEHIGRLAEELALHQAIHQLPCAPFDGALSVLSKKTVGQTKKTTEMVMEACGIEGENHEGADLFTGANEQSPKQISVFSNLASIVALDSWEPAVKEVPSHWARSKTRSTRFYSKPNRSHSTNVAPVEIAISPLTARVPTTAPERAACPAWAYSEQLAPETPTKRKGNASPGGELQMAATDVVLETPPKITHLPGRLDIS